MTTDSAGPSSDCGVRLPYCLSTAFDDLKVMKWYGASNLDK
ncbi:hypothetical protein [Xylocopilactobacillus apis]|nr:hypothetical protein [Xylocopilactobacillus apis]